MNYAMKKKNIIVFLTRGVVVHELTDKDDYDHVSERKKKRKLLSKSSLGQG